MKPFHQTRKSLVEDLLFIILVSGTVGIALKFTTFFENWVYFPIFPNIPDAMFLVLLVVYLFWRTKR